MYHGGTLLVDQEGKTNTRTGDGTSEYKREHAIDIHNVEVLVGKKGEQTRCYTSGS